MTISVKDSTLIGVLLQRVFISTLDGFFLAIKVTDEQSFAELEGGEGM